MGSCSSATSFSAALPTVVRSASSEIRQLLSAGYHLDLRMHAAKPTISARQSMPRLCERLRSRDSNPDFRDQNPASYR